MMMFLLASFVGRGQLPGAVGKAAPGREDGPTIAAASSWYGAALPGLFKAFGTPIRLWLEALQNPGRGAVVTDLHGL